MKTLEVSVIDKDGNQHATVQLKEEQLAKYLERHNKERTWGLPERWVEASRLSPEEIAQALESRERVNEFGETITEHKLAAEYSLTVTDITPQIEAQEQEAAAKTLAKQARKDKAKAFDAQTAKLKDIAEMVQAIAEELGLR